MRTDELDYTLPKELIAQSPADPRDASRLLVAAGRGDTLRIDDHGFADLPGLLRHGDLLVRNDTRVIPARTRCRKATGGRVELLFLEPAGRNALGSSPDDWEVLARGRLRGGETLRCDAAPDLFAVEVGERLGEGRWRVRPVSANAAPLADLLDRFGETPLPPYITALLGDPERYQTTYARLRGSAAAPTAGLHFTATLDATLRDAGVAIEHLTLHVGLATFKPVTVDEVEEHPLHEEPFVADAAAWERIAAARSAGRRIIAVGTTMVRLLEELGGGAPARRPGQGRARTGPAQWTACGGQDGPVRGRTSLFITPGHEFRVVDGMITNFHLPRTSLLALVMAFCGVEETRRIYDHAIARRYRFYSFGDAMLAWGRGRS
jgi:S-adenosylmethionine:tRNA ribosyltransferase-isomerase